MIKDITYLYTLFSIHFEQFSMRVLTYLSNKFNKKKNIKVSNV